MTLRYNLTGADRKRLVTAISEITGAPAKYLGAPSFAYQRGDQKPHRNAGQPGLHRRAAGGRGIRDCRAVSRRGGRAVHLHASQPVL